MRLYGVTGRKNAGKTTLVERLVREFTRRGLRVSTIKHAHHDTDIDQPGRDSHRHRLAGAHQVLLASPRRWALMEELRPAAHPPHSPAPEPTLASLLARLDRIDLVLIEGYKTETHPKIEIWRAATQAPLLGAAAQAIRALASDQGDGGTGLPVFDPEDIGAMADFILRETGLDQLARKASSMPPGVDWTPVDQVMARLRSAIQPLEAVQLLPLDQAAGHVLARDAYARLSHPPQANSAVDGYGFAFASTDFGAGPVPLAPGRAAAGAPWGQALAPGQALRILTGAILPEGVDTVALQEQATITPAGLELARPPRKPGANTRAAGEDLAAGDRALCRGQILRPQDLGLAAALGIDRLAVHPRLRVGVLSTGAELIEADHRAPAPGQIPDANRPMLLATLARLGFQPVDLGICRDSRADLRAALNGALGRVDAILTSGGASQGDEDHVAQLLRDEAELQDWRVAVKPGRPLALAHWPGTPDQNPADLGQAQPRIPIFGLPGNPVAAMICTLIFARPALLQRAGAGWREPQGFDLPADFAKVKQAGRREYLRARLSAEGRVSLFSSEGSGRISGLSWADGLVELPDGFVDIQPGDRVRYLPWSSFGL